MNPISPNPKLDIGRRLTAEVLQPMKEAFVGKDEVIDLLGVCLVGGENLFILGPPGTAKSALVHNLGARLEGETFDYLLTRFTEPNEIFGPFDIRKLREGELLTNTEGMLPEASLVFLDELLNANSAILNSLLTALNERLFRRGKESRPLKALMFVSASNRLPEDDALKALFDRFLLRVHCDNVPAEQLPEVLDAGWKLGENKPAPASLHAELIHRIRHSGIPVSDRRAVKLQKLMAGSALICGRLEARVSDLWILKYVWDTEDQQEILSALVQKTLEKAQADEKDHARAAGTDGPDPEHLARDLDFIEEQLKSGANGQSNYLRDRLSLLEGRCQWVTDAGKRDFLARRVSDLWSRFKATPASP
jgi:MoxR-like ATPase